MVCCSAGTCCGLREPIEGTVITAAAAPSWNSWTDLGSGPHTARALSASITRAGIWRKVLEFVRLPLPLLGVGRGRFFDHTIWPDFRIFRIQRQPFLKTLFGVRLDHVAQAFRHAVPTIEPFFPADD